VTVKSIPRKFAVADIERSLHELFVAVPGTRLRCEDLKKARELAGLLVEIDRALGKISKSRAPLIVDAACGKGYVSLLTAKLILQPQGRPATFVGIERDSGHAARAREAVARLRKQIRYQLNEGDVADGALWPRAPDLVIALHACGAAADSIIDCSVASGARHLLLVPCCTSKAVTAVKDARDLADTLNFPHQAEVRRRFYQAWVDASRTQRLEKAGYRVEVVAFVAPTVTPHNLLWRAMKQSRGNVAFAAHDPL
jgi:hypothetical protein